jgi:purine-binding chemotaxis protein CheW
MDTQPIITTDQKQQPAPTEQMVIFELDNEEYAVSILEVREVIKLPQITPVPNSETFISGIINLRGKVVPVLDLEKKFNLARENPTPSQHILIAEGDEGLIFGILVDRVSEVLKIPQTSIKPAPSTLAGKISADFLKGVVASNLESKERIMLILDLKKILSHRETESIKLKQNEQSPIESHSNSQPTSLALHNQSADSAKLDIEPLASANIRQGVISE